MSKAFDSYMGGATNTAAADANEFNGDKTHYELKGVVKSLRAKGLPQDEISRKLTTYCREHNIPLKYLNRSIFDGCEAEDADIAVGSKVQIVGGSFAGCHGVVKEVNGDVVKVDVGHGAEYSFRTNQVRAYDAAETSACDDDKPLRDVRAAIESTGAKVLRVTSIMPNWFTYTIKGDTVRSVSQIKDKVSKVARVRPRSVVMENTFIEPSNYDLDLAFDAAEATDAAEPLVSDADVVSYTAAAARALMSEERNFDAVSTNMFKAAFNLNNLAARCGLPKAKQISEWAGKVQDAIVKGTKAVSDLMRSRPF